MSTKAARRSRQERIEQALHEEERGRRRLMVWVIGIVSILVVVGVVAAMMLSSVPQSSSETRAAPDFTLTDTSGETVTLSDLRGRNVLIYFSEGAGCQSCLVQMDEIERRQAAFDRLDVTVLPVVMNSREEITHDMQLNGVETPFLLDDGRVSRAYDTLGKGMHAGLPGHSFVLVDKQGQQVWYGEYPSMWLAPQDLLDEVRSHLSA